MRGWRVLLAVGLAMAGAVRAEFVPDPGLRAVDLPPEREEPVRVEVDFFLLDVMAVNGAAESFSASVYFDVRWQDERLAFDAAVFGADKVIYPGAAADEQLATMWSPQVDVANLLGDPVVNDRSMTIFADGTVEYEVRLQGDFASPMELSRFPFDRQELKVKLESFLWTKGEVELVAVGDHRRVGEGVSIRGWRLLGVETTVEDVRFATGEVYSQFVSTIRVQRDPWFTIWSALFPLALVTFFALTCFFWDQETLTERVAQVLTCLLTATAMSLAVSDDLPKISYFTRVDYAFLLTYAVLLVVALESIWAKSLNERNHALADEIDHRSAWIVSVIYLVGMAAIFWMP